MASGWELYGWAGYQQRDGESAAFPRLRNNANNSVAVYPNGFLPLIATDIKDLSTGFGVKGEFGNWRTDISLVYGFNDVAYRTENSINGTLIPNSPTSFDSVDSTTTSWCSMQTSRAALTCSAGTHLRWRSASKRVRRATASRRARWRPYVRGTPAGGGVWQPDALGRQGFPGFPARQRGGRRPQQHRGLRRTRSPFHRQVHGLVGRRGEDYSDFGSELTWKTSARYDFTDSFALRGTVSTGFRAPGLQQTYFTSTATNFIGGVPFEVGTFPPSSAVAQALGAQPLQPEESTNYSLGAVFRLSGLRGHGRCLSHRDR